MVGKICVRIAMALVFTSGLGACAWMMPDAPETQENASIAAAPAPAAGMDAPAKSTAVTLPAIEIVQPVLRDCTYIIEIYEEYTSAPLHGVEREITACLNQAALERLVAQ